MIPLSCFLVIIFNFLAKINDFAQDDEHDIMFDDISSDVAPAPSSNSYISSSEEESEEDEDVQFYKPQPLTKSEKSRQKEAFVVDDVSAASYHALFSH